MDTQPRKASTVILVREPLEVLLMKRSTHDSFMARATVYPGGAMDESDNDSQLMDLSPGFNRNFLNKHIGITPGLFFTAIRELFEESLILLARKVSGKLPDLSGEPYLSRYEEYRKAVHDGKISLSNLAEKEGLIFTPEVLLPFAHWITPTFQKTRFDTWFFLAKLPSGQDAIHDDNELTSAEWLHPQKALELGNMKKMLLMPPTLMTLRELASFESADDLFNHASSKDIPSILPEAFADGNMAGVKLPNDPVYSDPARRIKSKPGEPSRIILEDGFWRLV